ncbi:MAG: chitobiase/beta-hexosaminidase C-terminal domain-containing protein [Spirochaetes bacterium]|nr:chitobiase/beta-hexosaminidase C-terminal domain-containing protein [Spirochaetota bacterium]
MPNCSNSLQNDAVSPFSFNRLEDLFKLNALPASISSVFPANTSSGISTTSQMRVQFATDMEPASINDTTISVTDENSNPVPGTVDFDAVTNTATFTPSASLGNDITYTITISTGILELSGEPLPYTIHISFTTVDTITVPAPEISLMSGTYSGSQTATISCTEPGAMISYTTDGTVPSRTNGTLVGAPASLAIAASMTLRAMAYVEPPAKSDSSITTASYNFITSISPVFSPTGGTFSSDQTVSLSSPQDGAVIYYTTDGSPPTVDPLLEYTGAIPVAGHGTSITINAMALAPGLNQSFVITETYSINYSQTSTPLFTPAGGGFATDTSVSITCSTPGAVIYYTTDGSDPTVDPIYEYTGAIPVAGNGTSVNIRALAATPGYLDSAIAGETYTITYPPADPVQFSPSGGTYNTDTSVTLSCVTTGAVIYYTTDGSAPTVDPLLEYTGAVPVTGHGTETTIRAIAAAPGYSNSAITEQTYLISWLNVEVPDFDIPAGTYAASFDVAVTTSTPLATVHYSTDGGMTWNPGAIDASSATVTIDAEGTTTLMAYASAALMLDSSTATRVYVIDPTLPPPVFSGLSTAATISSSQIDLSWDEATDNDTLPANILYSIYRSTVSGVYDYLTPSGTITGTLSYSVTGLSKCITYYFTVRASDAAGHQETNTVERSAYTGGYETWVDACAECWPSFKEAIDIEKALGSSAAASYTTFAPSVSNYRGGVLGPDGNIYAIPANATVVLEIDPDTDTSTTFGTIAGTESLKYAGGVLAKNGKIYGMPLNVTNVLVIDPVAKSVGYINGTPSGYWGGVLAPNGRIYCMPSTAGNVLVIDPDTETFYTIGSGLGSCNGGVLAPNGNIYAISSGYILLIDPDADTVSTFGSTPTGYRGAVLASNGMIYGIPWSSTCDTILKIDPTTNTATTFGDVSSVAATYRWAGGALAPNGKIYGMPYMATYVLEIDPDTETLNLISIASGPNSVGAVLAPNGKIYGMPYSSAIPVINPNSNGVWDINIALSAFFNKF